MINGLGRMVSGPGRIRATMIVCAMASMPTITSAQAATQGATSQAISEARSSAQSSSADREQQLTLDSVVAIVNGDLVLQSDVDAERHFSAFQPFTTSGPMTRDEVVNRLIDRTLILQQMELQPGAAISDDEVNSELNALRKSIPKCMAYHCEADAGWEQFIADQGYTKQELLERWRQRMEVLRFIEERFRMGIRVSEPEIHEYYKTNLLPAYEKEKAQPPAEATVADRIQEVLLQQRVDKLLDDWLAALRAEGGVSILKSGEEAP
ncbi:MAG TPA: peptidylprolyl isomerase [Acidobacteriaceae bacterium]|nr:peptidylprolyl isomerase [Acidobacteriaceae bacterium]